jgi:hypothetical protein
MAFEQGYALIIGVGSYQQSQERNVPMTVADGQIVADILKDSELCGYPSEQVMPLHDASATRQNILTALDSLAAKVTTKDTVLLFYSGHGEYDTSGNYVLTTHDTRWNGTKVAPGTAISQVELLDKLRAIKAERVLLIFNACHAGMISPVLGEGKKPYTGSTVPNQTANALLSTGSGRVIITACRENQFSFIGGGERTIFAQALADGLRGAGEEIYNRGGTISVFDLYTHLYDTVKKQVATLLDAETRKNYGDGQQEPELTVLKGVGPFAVALYRGASTLGGFSADMPATHTAVREVEPERSQRAFMNITGGQNVGGDNYGSMTQTEQNIYNAAPNEGAQGTFQGPVTFNRQQTTLNQQGQNIQGDQIQAGRDVNKVRGDYVRGSKNTINAEGSQGFVNQPTGSVSQHFGDTVGREKISGDLHVSGVSGGNVAIGHKSQAHSYQSGAPGTDLAQLFAPIYQEIESRPDLKPVKAILTEYVQKIQAEASKGQGANAQQIGEWFGTIAYMAPSVRDIMASVLLDPRAGVADSVKRIVQEAKQT